MNAFSEELIGYDAVGVRNNKKKESRMLVKLSLCEAGGRTMGVREIRKDEEFKHRKGALAGKDPCYTVTRVGENPGIKHSEYSELG